MFKTLVGFRSQVDKLLEKVVIAEIKINDAKLKQQEATKILVEKAKEIRGEADALVVRANQINAMLDALVPDTLS